MTPRSMMGTVLRDFRSVTGVLRRHFVRSKYEIKPGYYHRRRHHYFDDTTNRDGYQREVYEEALRIARVNHLRSVIDVGCGSGFKLVHYFGDFDSIGVDVEPTYSWLRKTYPDKKWVRAFTEESQHLNADLVICADVIEHVEDPDQLLTYLARCSRGWVVLSTPERDLARGAHHYGPPPNPAHVREWNFAELHRYIGARFEIESHEISNVEQRTQMVVFRVRSNDDSKLPPSVNMSASGK